MLTAAPGSCVAPHQTQSDRLEPKENKGRCLLSRLSPFNISFVTPSGITAGDCGKGTGGSKGSAKDSVSQTNKVAKKLQIDRDNLLNRKDTAQDKQTK